ncbi:hypothetical protein ENH_00040360 [Eimeria necatrix]|uniref:Uncharacterized protein n=1 Tax=Eimeria necatrix TaxID=51315 RepID=U6MYT3_9EIME|nr:hypothetical protein ENH_00040360 [Eimeria necatrix]CDJ67649.1 hypothetical protein ENH_00040360 [Eimeria necatrix]
MLLLNCCVAAPAEPAVSVHPDVLQQRGIPVQQQQQQQQQQQRQQQQRQQQQQRLQLLPGAPRASLLDCMQTSAARGARSALGLFCPNLILPIGPQGHVQQQLQQMGPRGAAAAAAAAGLQTGMSRSCSLLAAAGN